MSNKGLTDFFFKHKSWCPGVRQGLKDINLKSLIIIQYKLQVGKDGEASTDPGDWGECHSDCPLRGYRDNQVKISNFLPTDNVISICFDHMIDYIVFFTDITHLFVCKLIQDTRLDQQLHHI